MRRTSFKFLLTGALLIFSGSIFSQETTGTVRLLVGFSAGGASDILARTLAERLRTTLNQPVVVENKPGATGRLALSDLKRSKPDGLTLILSNNSPFTIFPHIYKNLEFDPIKDFTPIGRVTTYDLGISAGPKAPPGGIKEFLAWIKSNPQDATYGTSGAGLPGHFIGNMIGKQIGIPLVHVPYHGGASAMTGLASGQIPIVIDTILEQMEMAKSGRIRMLAIAGEKRLEILPDIPTLREVGIDVAPKSYVGIYGPAKMPEDKVQRISKALGEAMQSPELQKRIIQFAMTPAYSSPAELSRFQAEVFKHWEGPIKATGFIAD